MIKVHSKAHKGLWRVGIWGQLLVVAGLCGVIAWDLYHPELKEQMIEQVEYTKK